VLGSSSSPGTRAMMAVEDVNQVVYLHRSIVSWLYLISLQVKSCVCNAVWLAATIRDR
jgi:hypothetical protein